MAGIILAAAVLAAATSAVPAAPLVLGTFYQETVSEDCSFGAKTQCAATFTAVPANVSLVVTDASCIVRMKNTNTVTNLMMRGLNGNGDIIARYTFLPPSFTAVPGFQRQYLMQAKIGHGFATGQRPQIVAEAAGSSPLFTVVCTVAGTLQR